MINERVTSGWAVRWVPFEGSHTLYWAGHNNDWSRTRFVYGTKEEAIASRGDLPWLGGMKIVRVTRPRVWKSVKIDTYDFLVDNLGFTPNQVGAEVLRLQQRVRELEQRLPATSPVIDTVN